MRHAITAIMLGLGFSAAMVGVCGQSCLVDSSATGLSCLVEADFPGCTQPAPVIPPGYIQPVPVIPPSPSPVGSGPGPEMPNGFDTH